MWALVFLYLGRMRYAGWILFAVTAIALYWVWSTDVGAMAHQKDEAAKREKALRAEADSLGLEIAERDERLAAMTFRLDSALLAYDSAWMNQPSPEALYLENRAKAASLPYRRKWADMSVLPVDTTRGHAE